MANSTSPNGKTSKPKANNQYGSLFGESTRKTGLDADWNVVDSHVVLRIVWAVTTLGGSVTLGSNKKGTAYYAKVYLGQPFDAVYFDGDEEGRAALAEWADRLVNFAAESA